ncbi:MAG TPA: hypothetical protein VKV04_16630 [Verrucomicrobiae bacterium]|nr:hypothetical protein [Verrucomicrobiae bacterium]
MSKNTSMPPPDQSPDTEGIAPLPDLRKRGRLMEPNPSIRVSINPFIKTLKALCALLALMALMALCALNAWPPGFCKLRRLAFSVSALAPNHMRIFRRDN